jgi:hypothetical protein
MPPATCYMKVSDAVRRPSPTHGSDAYTSGCKDTSYKVAPTSPPTPAPDPTHAKPIVRGGGNCTDGMDCSLGGDCKNLVCVCDAQYTGDHCGVLRLRRTKLNNSLGSAGSSLHTWGGHALGDQATGKWVGFFRCDSSYVCESDVVVCALMRATKTLLCVCACSLVTWLVAATLGRGRRTR